MGHLRLGGCKAFSRGSRHGVNRALLQEEHHFAGHGLVLREEVDLPNFRA